MNQTETIEVPAKSRRGLWIKLAVIILFLLFAAIAVMNLPRGYSDDLSQLGRGIPAVVLVRDKNAVQSFDMLNVMDSLRDQYSGKVEFLLTDSNTPQGRAFMQANNADRTNLVLIDAEGNAVQVLYAPQSGSSLQQAIVTSFGIKP